MISKVYRLNPNEAVARCPRCGNNTVFTARADRCAEDCCDVWIECECGFDPTSDNTGHRLEDVWGSVDQDTVAAALRYCWNEPIVEAQRAAQRREVG